MAQSTTNLGKIHVFPSETLYNQFKDIIADNDLALLKDDGAYIVAALLEQNGYVKFSNGLILQWGVVTDDRSTLTFLLPFSNSDYFYAAFPVAPARERGLKLMGRRVSFRDLCRSREGAWIEIPAMMFVDVTDTSLPRGSVD